MTDPVRRVRTIGQGEWRELRAFRLRALADAPNAFGSTLERERAQSDEEWRELAERGAAGRDWHIAVATHGGSWTGMAWGHLPEDDPGLAWLFAMWVDPAARRSGIARELVEDVATWAAARVPVLELRVTDDNHEAIALYRATGFRDAGERAPLREGSSIETTGMRRDLAARPAPGETSA